MQGLPNNIERSDACRGGAEDRVLLSGLLSKLLDPCASLQERKGLPGSSNTVDVQEELGGVL